MTIDIDKIEALAKGGSGMLMKCSDVLALIAEVRALREALSTPIAMGIKWSPISSDMLSGFSQEVGESALKRDFAKAKNVTVYYGEKRVFTSMAEFCAAHPRGKA